MSLVSGEVAGGGGVTCIGRMDGWLAAAAGDSVFHVLHGSPQGTQIASIRYTQTQRERERHRKRGRGSQKATNGEIWRICIIREAYSPLVT